MRVNLRGKKPTKIAVFLKWICYLLVAVLSYIIMTTGNGVKPILLIPLGIAIAVREEELQSTAAAMVCGLLIDMACGKVFGMNAFFMVIFCVAASLLFGLLLRQNLINIILLTAVASLIQGGADFLFYHAIWDYGKDSMVFTGYILPQIIYTIISAVPIYYIIMFIADAFGVKEKTSIEEKNDNIVREYRRNRVSRVSEWIRLIIVIVLVCASLFFCALQLIKLQIVDGEIYLAQAKTGSSFNQTVSAVRGQILDLDGEAIVGNKVGYNVVVEKVFFPTTYSEQNEVILKLAKLLENDGISWIETLPITKDAPYRYIKDRESEAQSLREKVNVQSYASAQDCIDALIKMYDISEDYTTREKRIIAGVRYEMLLRSFSLSNRYTFAEDIPIETVAKVKENSYKLSGVDVVEEAVRVYAMGDILAHSIGTIGPIYAEEYAAYKELGYGYNDVVGKSGIEKAMESYLRGQNGTNRVTLVGGEVVSVDEATVAVPGNTVQLTIDADFQEDVQNILAEHIAWLKENKYPKPTNKDYSVPEGGAIVVIDVKTGAIRALVNYPNYDINDYLTNYTELLNGENLPLFNRAISGGYRPGSTFKSITATAALAEQIITPTSTINCGGKYMFFDDYRPSCLGVHGNINVMEALRVSCNIFFYDTGRQLGIDNITKYAADFGLGEDLGLEIGGRKGYVSSPEVFKSFQLEWTSGNVIQTAIGQLETSVSPLQLAVQAATIANGGVRYKPFMVDSINTYNMEEQLYKITPEVQAVIEDTTGTVFSTVTQGMIMAGNFAEYYGVDYLREDYLLSDLPYDVAIKTGTPESPRGTDSAFIGFAPADDPEIAFAGIIEGGEYSKLMIKSILEAYYENK